MSSADLKHTAYLSMLVDHFFAVVFWAYITYLRAQGQPWSDMYTVYRIGRAIGRIAFILFAFMMVEGFLHTRSKEKYLLRLGIFALLSEIPFDLAINGEVFTMNGQNVYFTLFLGVMALYFWKTLKGRPVMQFAGAALCCMLAALLKTDYMFMGVMLILVFYLCRKSFWLQFVVGSVTIYVGIVLVYVVRYYGQGIPFTTLLKSGRSELYGLLAFILIYFYNGQKGKQLPKACYYLFYPIHLLLLYGMKRWFFG
ncbi:MAG: conjugal transfer protein TraX [Muribaculaceae bacterium]|nr:conjugal transfer protein TraX [Muribaculaceae bacterium]